MAHGPVRCTPCAGPGQSPDRTSVLADTAIHLRYDYRQAQQSGVVTNAHRIKAGQMPVTRDLPGFFLFAEDDNERMADLTVDIVATRSPNRRSGSTRAAT